MDNQAETVAVGSHVQVELVNKTGQREQLAFDLVPDHEADFASGRLSANTPLARAILGKTPGQVVPYRTGDLVEVKILSVSARASAPTEDAAAQREAKMRQALNQADLANAISFALTFDSKWGDYDPEGIASNWNETPGESKTEKGSDDKQGEEK